MIKILVGRSTKKFAAYIHYGQIKLYIDKLFSNIVRFQWSCLQAHGTPWNLLKPWVSLGNLMELHACLYYISLRSLKLDYFDLINVHLLLKNEFTFTYCFIGDYTYIHNFK